MTVKELYEEAIRLKCENAEIYKYTDRLYPVYEIYKWYNSSEAPYEAIIVLR